MTKNTFSTELAKIAIFAQDSFTRTHEVREKALALSRQIVRNSANAIRAAHRGEFNQAQVLLEEVANLVQEIDPLLQNHPKVRYAGYVEDALKEYAEASTTLAITSKTSLPGPEDLGVSAGPYLNGLAEAVGELRRFILDSLRKNDFSQCENLLYAMDEVYSVLVTMDFPEAVTNGLRRSTDMVRGTLERTRGDLTLAIRQHRLEERLSKFDQTLEATPDL